MNKYTEAIQGDDVVILCDGIPMGVGEILAALNAATPLPADAALADAVALLRRTYQNHWPSTEIKAFLAKIDAMPDAALRALSQPGVAQVPAVPMAAIETVLHFCSPHEDASKEDCSKCSAAYEEVSNWRDALLSAAPSAKGGE